MNASLCINCNKTWKVSKSKNWEVSQILSMNISIKCWTSRRSFMSIHQCQVSTEQSHAKFFMKRSYWRSSFTKRMKWKLIEYRWELWLVRISGSMRIRPNSDAVLILKQKKNKTFCLIQPPMRTDLVTPVAQERELRIRSKLNSTFIVKLFDSGHFGRRCHFVNLYPA